MHAVNSGMQVLYVNQVGGNDELVFQGHSMVWDETGELVATGADFKEDLIIYDTKTRKGEFHASSLDDVSEVREALVLGLRDYSRKCGFQKAVLGLSGGVDSALVACLAALALGPDKVLGVAMPGPYNAPESLSDARELADRLGISFDVIPIADLFDGALKTLAPVFGDLPADVTEENLQARLRGLILMALSNKFHRLLLSTGNKSELAVGYCTLYGDMNGGLGVLGDVPKTLVYDLARKLNEQYNWIPERIITRPPSAELRPDQKDQDSLPPYEVLDAILSAYVERRLPASEIVAQGWDPKLVQWVINHVDRNEYKRWQAPPVLRVTAKAFGTGRRLPIAQGYREG
jgi:NAD+ synthetase